MSYSHVLDCTTALKLLFLTHLLKHKQWLDFSLSALVFQ